ncbi:MAG: hypothetical protein ACLSBH_20885 [Coprobacillus cateniformis]
MLTVDENLDVAIKFCRNLYLGLQRNAFVDLGIHLIIISSMN